MDHLWMRRNSYFGLMVGSYLSYRMARNQDQLEEHSRANKLFDPVKAKAQVQVYKEIYNIEDDSLKPEQDVGLKILEAASKEDKEEIRRFFERKGEEKSDLEREMERLKQEISSLEEVKAEHQGFRFYRTVMTKDTFEDALIELREREFEKKFKKEQEFLIGQKPKTI